MLISIIIPTFNRAESLAMTLGSIADVINISKHKQLEVLVIDNKSTDHTKEVCESWAQKIPQLQYHFEPIPGLLSGRHRGAEASAGEILCFIDDDVILSPTWIDSIAEIMSNQAEIKLLTGPNLPKFEITPPDWLAYFWNETPYGGKSCIWLSLLDLGNKSQLIDANYVWGLNFTIRRETFQQAGGFHPDNIPKKFQCFQGDGETGLTMKANEKGFKALYHPEILLYHFIPKSRLNIAYFDQRAFYQGVGNSYTSIRRKFGLYKKEEGLFSSGILKVLKNILSPLKQQLQNKISKNIIPGEIQILKERLKIKEREGFGFHQALFKTDKTVRNWVLKENYFNYVLPEKHD